MSVTSLFRDISCAARWQTCGFSRTFRKLSSADGQTIGGGHCGSWKVQSDKRSTEYSERTYHEDKWYCGWNSFDPPIDQNMRNCGDSIL